MSEIENNPHQALIEEKVAEFKELGVGYEDSIEPILDVLPNIDHPELGTYSFEKWLTQTLQATIDTVLEKQQRELLPFMQHDLQCAAEFEAGDCDCGLKEALTPRPDKE